LLTNTVPTMMSRMSRIATRGSYFTFMPGLAPTPGSSR